MNTRSKSSSPHTLVKNFRNVSSQKRQQTTTQLSTLSTLSTLSINPSFPMTHNSSDSSDIKTAVSSEQIHKLSVDNKNLEKQLESQQLLVTQEGIEQDDLLPANQPLIPPLQVNQQQFQVNDEPVPELNEFHSHASNEKPSLLNLLRNHISPFTGSENAYQWFIQLDSTFYDLKLSLTDRLEILPYFFVGRAMIWYSLHKHKIHHYTDFCQLFAFEYLNIQESADPYSLSQSPHKSSSILIHKVSSGNLVGSLSNITMPFIPHDSPSSDLTNPISSYSLSSKISKALLDKFIKDPLKFYGNKDNVITWLDEIEQQLQIIQLSESDKFNLIHICLKGEAQQWYRQHKTKFTCWSQFASELTKCFNSNLQRDIAFKKLQQYHQTSHQSAFQYYNEMIKLIQQADSQMSESTKVHYLMNGLRSSLCTETRRNYPTTTDAFLTQVKIAEDLTALNTFTNRSMTHDDAPPHDSYYSSKSTNPTSTNAFIDSSRNSNATNYRYQNNYRHQNNYASADNNNNPRYLNKISHSSSSSYEPNRFSQSSHPTPNVTSSNYPPPSLDKNNYRNNDVKQQTQQTFQRCFKCNSLDHIARDCSRFDQRSQ